MGHESSQPGETFHDPRMRGFRTRSSVDEVLSLIGRRIGRRNPVHCTSVGKAILAHLPESQQDEILKAEYQKTLKDAAMLIDLAEQLKAELEKNDRFVLSLATIKKTEEIEKLAKKIRTRLHH